MAKILNMKQNPDIFLESKENVSDALQAEKRKKEYNEIDTNDREAKRKTVCVGRDRVRG